MNRYVESPVYLQAPEGPLLAVETEPTVSASGHAVLLCPGGWFGTATNRNRLLVRLARRLAGSGHHVLRFDWHGVGESMGSIERYRLDEPFTGDVLAGAHHLIDAGFEHLSIAGLCFGSGSALAASTALIPRLRALVLVSFTVPLGPSPRTLPDAPGLGAVVRRAVSPAALSGLGDPSVRRAYRKQARTQWRRAVRRITGGTTLIGPSPIERDIDRGSLVARLDALSSAGVATLFLFGEHDTQLAAFERFRVGQLDEVIRRNPALMEVAIAPGDLSGFGTVAAQDETIRRTVQWIDAHVPVSLRRSRTR